MIRRSTLPPLVTGALLVAALLAGYRAWGARDYWNAFTALGTTLAALVALFGPWFLSWCTRPVLALDLHSRSGSAVLRRTFVTATPDAILGVRSFVQEAVPLGGSYQIRSALGIQTYERGSFSDEVQVQQTLGIIVPGTEVEVVTELPGEYHNLLLVNEGESTARDTPVMVTAIASGEGRDRIWRTSRGTHLFRRGDASWIPVQLRWTLDEVASPHGSPTQERNLVPYSPYLVNLLSVYANRLDQLNLNVVSAPTDQPTIFKSGTYLFELRVFTEGAKPLVRYAEVEWCARPDVIGHLAVNLRTRARRH